MVVRNIPDNLFSSNTFTTREIAENPSILEEEAETKLPKYSFTDSSDSFESYLESLQKSQENFEFLSDDDIDRIWQFGSELSLPEFDQETELSLEEKIANINQNLESLNFDVNTNIEDIKSYKEELDAAEATITESVLAAPGQRLGTAVTGTIEANYTVQKLQNEFNENAKELLAQEEYSEENKNEVAKLLEAEQSSVIDRDLETWNSPSSEVLVEGGGKATWYDPALGGINGNGDGLTATGVRFNKNKFSAAAFPELLELLPEEYTKPASKFRGGITLAKPVNLLVEDTNTGKKIIISLNDVGPGTSNHSSNHYLDLSPAARDALGANEINDGLRISIAPEGTQPGNYIAETN